MPVAAGERNTTIWEFAEYLERPGVAFIRPDVGIAGGITHVKKICALAEAFHAGILPHAVPSGPVAVAAHVQLGMCVPNWEVQEHVPQDEPRWTDLVDHVIEVRDGYLIAPERPGLGIDLDDAGLAKHPPVVGRPLRPAAARGRLGGDPVSGADGGAAGWSASPAARRCAPRLRRRRRRSRAWSRSPTSPSEAFAVASRPRAAPRRATPRPRPSWPRSPPTSTCSSSATARPSSAPRCSRPRRG